MQRSALSVVLCHSGGAAFQQSLSHVLLPLRADMVQCSFMEMSSRLTIGLEALHSAHVHVAHKRQQQLKTLVVARRDASMNSVPALTVCDAHV